MAIPITEPEKINEKELMEYYKVKGKVGNIRFKLRLLKNWFLSYLAARVPAPGLRVKLHRMKGTKIGKHVYIGTYCEIDPTYPHLIEIEDYVSIGMHSMIFAHANPTNSYLIKAKLYPRTTGNVKIGKGTWIPPGCIILPDVTIGEHCILGAGSLVNKDIPSKSMAVGSPAKPIKELDL